MVAEGAVEARRTQAPLLCTGTSTHFTSLNSEWERMLGWTDAELMSRPFADFVHPGDRDRTMAEAARVGMPGYEVVDFENRFRARGGKWRRLRWSARADGRSWVAAAIDVTDERQDGLRFPSTWSAGAQPAPSVSEAGSRTGTVAVGVGLAAVCLVAIAIALGGSAGSSATSLVAAPTTRELAPHMSGPLNGAGPIYTLRGVVRNPPAMLGPRRTFVRPHG